MDIIFTLHKSKIRLKMGIEKYRENILSSLKFSNEDKIGV